MKRHPSGWNKTLTALGLRRAKRDGKRRSSTRGRRPKFEGLEIRQMLTTVTVDTLIDEDNGVNSGAGTSLREAISSAAANDDIEFDSSLDGGTIALELGELLIDKNLQIVGPGADELTIDAQENSRVFRTSGASTVVSISGIGITGGRVDSSSPLQNKGGGIYNEGTLTLDEVEVFNNQTDFAATSGANNGGGVYSTGTLTIEDGWIHDNRARWGGGVEAALDGNETFELVRSTVSDNVGLNDLDQGVGGGLELSHTTASETLLIHNSTISSNNSVNGGGVRIKNSTTKVEIINSTITLNSADNGGGINNNGSSSQLTVQNSIVAGNEAPTNPNLRNGGTLDSTNITSDSGLNLLPLGDYGGATPTHAPSPESSAIDVGNNNIASNNSLTIDQRGDDRQYNRPDVPNAVDHSVDAGAFELGETIGIGGLQWRWSRRPADPRQVQRIGNGYNRRHGRSGDAYRVRVPSLGGPEP